MADSPRIDTPKKRLRRALAMAAPMATIVAAIVGTLAKLYGPGALRFPTLAAVRVAGPYLAIVLVGAVVFFALRRHTDRRIAELRTEIQKTQADADTALYVLRNPAGLRVLLERGRLPSGVFSGEVDATERDALTLGERLGIVNVEDLGDGRVAWSWLVGNEKPLDPTALTLSLPGAPGPRF